MSSLQSTIESLWEKRDTISATTQGAPREAVEAALEMLDSGKARVAEPKDGNWHVNQ